MDKFKVAIIGTGGRSVAYAKHYANRDDMEIVALVDPREQNRELVAKIAKVPKGYAEYEDWKELYDNHTDLDGVVVCTPNHVHAEQTVPFLERGLAVVLEKPIAITKHDCERILAAERANGGRVLVGFVLRSTPFYSTVYRLIRDGAIGKVHVIEADELIGWVVTSIMNRNEYKRHRVTYGSAILSKCCHDMDILNWMMGCRPTSVTSYGRRNMFNRNPTLPETCDRCGSAKDCRYFKEPPLAAEENPDDTLILRFMRENNRCIYNIDKDIVDTQVLAIEYEYGQMATFTMMMNHGGERSGRNFHALGDKGRIWGTFPETKIYRYDNATGEVTEHACEMDESGHGGGDEKLTMELLTMMRDRAYRPMHSAQAGYESALACFAADVSRREGRRIDIAWGENGIGNMY